MTSNRICSRITNKLRPTGKSCTNIFTEGKLGNQKDQIKWGLRLPIHWWIGEWFHHNNLTRTSNNSKSRNQLSKTPTSSKRALIWDKIKEVTTCSNNNWVTPLASKCYQSPCRQKPLPRKDLQLRMTWFISSSRWRWCFRRWRMVVKGKACLITRIRRRSGPHPSYIIWPARRAPARNLPTLNGTSRRGNWRVSNNDRRQRMWEVQIRRSTKVIFWAHQVLCRLRKKMCPIMKKVRP